MSGEVCLCEANSISIVWWMNIICIYSTVDIWRHIFFTLNLVLFVLSEGLDKNVLSTFCLQISCLGAESPRSQPSISSAQSWLPETLRVWRLRRLCWSKTLLPPDFCLEGFCTILYRLTYNFLITVGDWLFQKSNKSRIPNVNLCESIDLIQSM